MLKKIFPLLLSLVFYYSSNAQIDSDGCVGANFGIDADLYSDLLQFGNHGGVPASGTDDWFYSGTGPGAGIIDENITQVIQALLQAGGNPVYEASMNSGLSSVVNGQIRIDAIFARDQFGGSGAIDQTSYTSSSKNGENPAIWSAGPANVLGKNDLIDVAGHMRRDGITLNDDLWFYGIINRASPGGSAYMDFELFVTDVTYTPGSGFSSGGPNLGHTAFKFDAAGNITKIGDIIFNVSLANGGIQPDVGLRLWVSRSDYLNINPVNFNWAPEFDGAFNGAPFGYAGIIPNNPSDACGNLNLAGQTPNAPPWGTLNTSNNNYQTTYAEYSVMEVGVNLTGFGIDHSSLLGSDPCDYPFSTFMVKTRASGSFTAQLKDFAGPYIFGKPTMNLDFVGDPELSCLNPEVTISANPVRNDVTYSWSTVDGNIISDPTLPVVTINQPGNYSLTPTLPTGCPIPDAVIFVIDDPTKPLFEDLGVIPTDPCSISDGSINITVNGATSPFQYNWSNGATTEDLTGVTSGDYTVTVTDAIGCTIEETITVSSHTQLNVNSTSGDANCFGDNSGFINLTTIGEAPFIYNWSNGPSSEDISGLSAAIYTVTVTDSYNCMVTHTAAVNQPANISLSYTSSNETGITSNDGSIDLSPSGGTPGYMYSWSNGETTEDLVSLANGIYTLTVTDANGCLATNSITIYEPETCNDGMDNDGDGLTDCNDQDCIPQNPGPISSSNPQPCVGDSGIIYSISDVGVPQYDWTVPPGATITAGQGTIAITVTWNTIDGGLICVRSNNVGCLSAQSCITVVPNDPPDAPGTIQIGN